MKTLFCLTEVADSQELQGPLIHCINAKFVRGNRITAKLQRRKCLNTGPIATHAVCAKPVARLQERQSHALGFLTRAIHAANTLQHLENSGLISASRIQKDGLQPGHRQRYRWIVRQEAVSRGRHELSRLRITRNSTGSLSILQVILNKGLELRFFLNTL